jgi:hypothetical protein
MRAFSNYMQTIVSDVGPPPAPPSDDSTCGDVDGFPSSPARPTMYATPLFTTLDGREATDTLETILPVAKVRPHD